MLAMIVGASAGYYFGDFKGLALGVAIAALFVILWSAARAR